MTILCDKGHTLGSQTQRRGPCQAGVPAQRAENAQGQGWREAAQPPSPLKGGGGARGGSAAPPALGRRSRSRGGRLSSPAFWGVLARAHLHLICMAIHPLPAFPAPQQPFPALEKGTGPGVPLSAASHTVPPRGRDNGGGEEVGAGSGWPARPVGTIVREALSVCIASALAAERGAGIPRMLPGP